MSPSSPVSGTPAATVDRLAAEFPNRVSRRTITTVLQECLGDLTGTPSSAVPELSERAARQRLLSRLDAPGAPVTREAPPAGAFARRQETDDRLGTAERKS